MERFLGKYIDTNHLTQKWMADGLKLVSLSLLVFVLSSCEDKNTDNETQEKKGAQTSNDKLLENKDAVEVTQPELDKDKRAAKEVTDSQPNQNQTLENSDYTAEFVPAKMTVQEKKKRFKMLIVPAVETVYSELISQYEQVFDSIGLDVKSEQQIQKIQSLKTIYKVSTDEQLLMAIKPHPKSIALAQAAMESAWGTSRFFREGKNIFGVWSFNENEPRIAASKKRGNKTIWLKKYSTITDAIRDYYKVLAKGRAFVGFRQQKMLANDPYELVKHLDKYSEKGAEYGKELASMIRYNKFEQFD